MALILKSLLVFIFAWIASIWPGAWTALLMLIALSAMCMGMALESHFATRAEKRRTERPRGRAAA